MKVFYTLVILVYTALIRIVSLFNEKAALWVGGRKDWAKKARENTISLEKKIWMHCASLGEFEQGRPVIELIRERLPDYKILVSFFSPSGYEIRKDWKGADYVFYLPADTPSNARKLLNIINPSVVLFVKYEFWNNIISEIHRRRIPLILISGIFRPDQHFFKWYGGFFRSILRKFTHFFVQDQRSAELLRASGINNVTMAGDTRFDRVSTLAGAVRQIAKIESFLNGEKVIVAGSSWTTDEEIIARFVNRHPGFTKWIIAPHEIGSQNIERIEKLFSVNTVRFSAERELSGDERVMIIDNIGLLSSVYAYATIAVIGGGFGKGIHNILEPACRNIPVLFGPNHDKFREALDLISEGGAFCYNSYEEFAGLISKLIEDDVLYRSASFASGSYVSSNTGASEKIVGWITDKRY